MKSISLFLSLFIYISLNSQNIDSLKRVVNSQNSDEKIRSCLKLVDYYFYSLPDSTKKYLDIGLKIARANNQKKKEAIFIQFKGILANEQGNFEIAKTHFQKTIEIAKNISDTSLLISGTGNLANVYVNFGEYEKAIGYFIKIDSIAKMQDNTVFLGKINGAIGNLYMNMESYEKALVYFNKSKSYFKKIKDEEGIALIYLNIAGVLNNTKRYEEALEYLSKASVIFLKIKNQLNLAKCYSVKADIYSLKNKYNQSIKENNKALEIYIDYKTTVDEMLTYSKLSDNYLKLKKYNTALNYLDKAFKIAKKENSNFHLSVLTDKYRTCYDSLRNYEMAYYYANLFRDYNDSIYSEESKDKFSELEVKYETLQKEQEIELLKKDNEIQYNVNKNRQLILFGVISLLILSILILYLIYNRYKLKSTKKTIEVEQKLLRTQMNPHFIFNALFAIENFMRKNNIEQSSQYISDFSKLMRLILESSRKEYISLNEEVEIIEYYIKFQKLRFNNKFTYKITFSDNIDKENTLIPPMLIQPFIENAIEHGFTKEIEKPHLDISFSLKEDRIFIKVEDNGKGINNLISEKENHQSLAIQITEERLSMLKRNKKKNINLKISNLANTNPELKGTRVSFNIPHIEEF